MPEMLQFCGRRFRVYRSAHKTCDTLKTGKNRAMNDAVHLEGLRCDGEAHGQCQAACLLFWKTAWLKRCSGPEGQEPEASPKQPHRLGVVTSRADLEITTSSTQLPENGGEPVPLYRCQATEMYRATTRLPWWDLRHYVKDLATGNVSVVDFVRYVAIATYNRVARLYWRLRPYPFVSGLAGRTTPSVELHLREGEWVEVRSKDEIMRTLKGGGNRNRGLTFDVEMVPYCGGKYRVLRKVEQIINEKTGKMLRFKSPCLILDGVVCRGCLSQNRLFCPRSIYSYWHEVWLKRLSGPAKAPGAAPSMRREARATEPLDRTL